MMQDIDGAEPRMIREFSDFAGKAVLEVGCGDGRMTPLLVDPSGRLAAIDPDPARLALAKSRVGDADFALGLGEWLGFRDGSIGTVAFTFSLHHIDASKALAEAHRVLEKGGQLLVVEPTPRGEVLQIFQLFKDESLEQGRAREALTGSGFVPEREAVFASRWSFRDREELMGYYFKGSAERDAEVVRRIDGILGKRVDLCPLFLGDESWICSMRKPADE